MSTPQVQFGAIGCKYPTISFRVIAPLMSALFFGLAGLEAWLDASQTTLLAKDAWQLRLPLVRAIAVTFALV